MLGKPRILSLSSTRLINSIKHEHSCKIIYLLHDAVAPIVWVWDGGGDCVGSLFYDVVLGAFLV